MKVSCLVKVIKASSDRKGIGMIKGLYVSCMRSARRVLEPTGRLDALARSRRQSARWLRSLFSIYDSNDMVLLDTPWWTYTAIDAVQRHLTTLNGTARVFEFGAGASTIWLAKRAATVTSVEHDASFIETMRQAFSAHENLHVALVPPVPATGRPGEARSLRKGYESDDFSKYVSTIHDIPGSFDVIVIDGRARDACFEVAMTRLAPGGIIVFDNSNRRRYQHALATSGMDATRYRGLAPALPYRSETTILQAPR